MPGKTPDIRGKNKIKKRTDLCTGERGFILEILQYIMTFRFRLETIYFDNNKHCYILLNKLFCLQLQWKLNNGRNYLIFGPYIFAKKVMVSVNKQKSVYFQMSVVINKYSTISSYLTVKSFNRKLAKELCVVFTWNWVIKIVARKIYKNLKRNWYPFFSKSYLLYTLL